MQSDRLLRLPPYLFVEIDRRKAEYVGSGGRVLDLGIGDPDLGAPAIVIERLKEALGVISHHRYPPGTGLPMLKSAIRDWAGREYGVAPGDDEILVTIGSKEAIAHLPLATVDPGSMVLVPDPGYPVYHSSAVFAGADSHRMPLTEVNGFLPEFSGLDADVRKKARLVYLNYPNNPTAATAGPGFFEEAIGFSRETGSILVNDAAYSGIVFEGKAEALFPAAIEAGIEYAELFSFSKTLSITGWRVGFAIGSPAVISALGRFKANVDSGVFSAIQEAIARVLDED
ncbi:MAG TPA: aminotransferase class I/II-fold pyridoxal phosphate-dependent enzyme, partial [Candidatus Krumholzibacterium sp.]|nr:aminotransferase class I/II-fold pyridoxal phosphate-dependent enzyme [Candidatus Krumholzibacterium sp.]